MYTMKQEVMIINYMFADVPIICSQNGDSTKLGGKP